MGDLVVDVAVMIEGCGLAAWTSDVSVSEGDPNAMKADNLQ